MPNYARQLQGYGRVKPPQQGAQVDWTHPLSWGLAGCWLVDEGPPKALVDIASNQPVGTVTGTPLISTSPYGPAINFGTGNYFTVTRKKGPANQASAWSFAALVYVPSIATTQCLIQYGEVTDTNFTLGMGLDTAGNITLLSDGFSSTTQVGPAIKTNAWYFIGMQQLNVSSRMGFANGVFSFNTQTRSSSATAGGLVIGTTFRNAAHVAGTDWLGLAACIYSWSRALTMADFVNLYREPFAFITQPAPKRPFAHFVPPVVTGQQFLPAWANQANLILPGGGPF